MENFQSSINRLGELSNHHENWYADIKMPATCLTKLVYQSLNLQQIRQCDYQHLSLFSLNNTSQGKLVMIIDPSVFAPSLGWDKLSSYIQNKGYDEGMHLVIGSTNNKSHSKSFICFRGRKYRKNKDQILEDNNFNDSGFSVHAKAKKIRRSKATESSLTRAFTPNTPPIYKHSTTRRPQEVNFCCSFRLTIWIDIEKDLYLIKSGTGNNCHNGHPKLSKAEINPLSTTAPTSIIQLRDQMSSVASPLTVTRRVVHNATGMMYHRKSQGENVYMFEHCIHKDSTVHWGRGGDKAISKLSEIMSPYFWVASLNKNLSYKYNQKV